MKHTNKSLHKIWSGNVVAERKQLFQLCAAVSLQVRPWPLGLIILYVKDNFGFMFGLVVLLQNTFGGDQSSLWLWDMMTAVFLNTVDTIYSDHIPNFVEMQPQTRKLPWYMQGQKQ